MSSLLPLPPPTTRFILDCVCCGRRPRGAAIGARGVGHVGSGIEVRGVGALQRARLWICLLAGG